MKFKDNEHERYYNNFISNSRYVDDYRKALFYTLAIDEETRKNVNKLFDFKGDCIIPEGLRDGFQTGSSIRVTRMAFNLYTDNTTDGVLISDNEGYGDDAKSYSPVNLFDCCHAPYFWEAIKIRFPYLSSLSETDALMNRIGKEAFASE